MTVISIPKQDAPSATTTLRKAITEGFESVIVFGFKDGKVLISASDIEDNFRLIGALDAAKQQVWANA